MTPETRACHESVVAIGKRLGLHADREVSLVVGDSRYAPRLDVLWTMPLSRAQLDALEEVRARPAARNGGLLVAAWEVEGSDASTKGMQADLANMRIFGAAFAFLAARGGTKDNLFGRACRLTRTFAHHFGGNVAIPLDSRWLEDLGKVNLSSRPRASGARQVLGGGGEGSWAGRVRKELRAIGEHAGFEVIDSYPTPQPKGAELTRSEIDMVWTLPMPHGLRAFVEAIGERERALVDLGLIVPERFERVVVAAFELENDDKKHGHGGLLNLASHGMSGVFISGNKGAHDAALAAIESYRGSLPLSRVAVNGGFVQ